MQYMNGYKYQITINGSALCKTVKGFSKELCIYCESQNFN